MTADALAAGPDGRPRCFWAAGAAAEYLGYHDEEWGRPVTDDDRLFERLCLEAFQSGLSWLTILRKRESFRAAFAGFHIPAVAAFGPDDVERLLADAGIVRNRRKIEAALANAQAAAELVRAEGSLAAFFWAFRPAAHAAPRRRADYRRRHARVGGAHARAQAPRLSLRGPHHRVRAHAGRGPRERPRGRLLRARRGGARAARGRRAPGPLSLQ